MKTYRLSSMLGTALVGLNVFSGCAQPVAMLQTGNIDVFQGEPAKTRELATAKGGPGKGTHAEKLCPVALFDGNAMPAGVTVSHSGRIFLSFPRWGDKVINTAVELKDGRLVPFPDEQTNNFDPNDADEFDPGDHLVSVQSLVVDAKDRLWLLDPGSINFAPVISKAPKLWAYDLQSGRKVKSITFPNDVVLKTTYLNDVRFDLERGSEGTAYITDSGAGGIIIIDIASGRSWRHLDDAPAVKSEPGLRQVSEGQAFLERKPSGEIAAPDFKSDGIALSPDGKTLYFTPVVSRTIYAVPTDMLMDGIAEERVLASVSAVAEKPSGTDGIFCDRKGRIYTTDFEDNAIRRIDPKSKKIEVLVQDERLLWPDTLAMHNGELFIVSNQLARQAGFNGGTDKREPPYALFKVTVD